MGVRGWRSIAVLVSFFSTFAFANDWYAEIAAIYDRSSVPQAEKLGTEKVWLGKCALSSSRKTRIPSALYVSVDRDPLTGPLYQVVQLFEHEQMSTIEKARVAARALILNAANLDAGLKHSASSKAWVMELGDQAAYRTILLREWNEPGKDVAFFVQAVGAGDARAYCYYYQPLKD